MSRALFRPEVALQPRGHWLGQVSRTQPPAWPWFAAWAFTAAIGGGGLLMLGSYTPKLRVEGALGQRGHDGQLLAQFELDARDAKAVSRGTRAVLRFPAYPHRRYGLVEGRVLTVTDTAARDDDAAKRRVRVEVAVHDAPAATSQPARALRPGLRVEADLFGQRRPLIEWLNRGRGD